MIGPQIKMPKSSNGKDSGILLCCLIAIAVSAQVID
jgi:hypothetical protein